VPRCALVQQQSVSGRPQLGAVIPLPVILSHGRGQAPPPGRGGHSRWSLPSLTGLLSR
jgi:hypothetical protein